MYNLIPKSKFASSVGNGLFNSASLDLAFAKTKSLVDAITGQNLVTFTRASSGTYVDSQGVIRTATTNLVTFSQTLNNAAWLLTGTNATLTATTDIAAPNGSMTAWTLTCGSGGSAQIQQAYTGISGVSYTGSFWVRRRSGTNTVAIRVSENTNTTLVGVTSDWQRFSFTATSTTTTIRLGIHLIGTTDAVDIWGAQLEQSSTVGEYIPTTSTINSAPRFDHNPTTGESLGLLVEEQRTNLLLQSEDFSTTWGLSTATVSTNVDTAPNGSLTADKLIVNSGASSGYAAQSNSYTSGTTYAFSVYAKAAGATDFRIVLLATSFGSSSTAQFNLSNGTVTSFSGAWSSVAISAVGNGWYRVSGIATATATANSSSRFQCNATGDGSIGVLIWGAQLEAGSFPTSYIPTTTATVTRSADVASSTGSNFGVSRTNLLLRSEEFGTSPWSVAGTATITANQETAPSGTVTADLITTTSGGPNRVLQAGVGPTSTTYTVSVYVKSGNINGLLLRLFFSGGTTIDTFAEFIFNSGSFTNINGVGAFAAQNVGGGWFRISCTASSGNNTAWEMRIGGLVTTAQTGTTAYLWGAQLETGTTATAYIPTTSAAVTVFESSWYRQDEGTVFVESRVQDFTVTNFSRIASLDRGDATTNFAAIVRSSATSRVEYSVFAGTGQAVGLQPTITLASGSTVRSAFVYRTNDFLSAANGILSTADTTGSVPTSLTTLGIGMQGNGALPYNGTIRRLTYWPQRLNNSTLQQITQ